MPISTARLERSESTLLWFRFQKRSVAVRSAISRWAAADRPASRRFCAINRDLRNAGSYTRRGHDLGHAHRRGIAIAGWHFQSSSHPGQFLRSLRCHRDEAGRPVIAPPRKKRWRGLRAIASKSVCQFRRDSEQKNVMINGNRCQPVE